MYETHSVPSDTIYARDQTKPGCREYFPSVDLPPPGTRRCHRFAILISLCLLTWFGFTWYNDVPHVAQASSSVCGSHPQLKGFNWSELRASEKPQWTRCYDTFECARLAVPLDYSNPNGEMAAIALVKLPAKVKSTELGYRGPILFNPGGPGLLGTEFILRTGDMIRIILGHSYDLIGFDSRGIGHTTPLLEVFETPTAQAAWILQSPPIINATTNALGLNYGRAEVIGRLAEQQARSVAEQMSTPVVARDMLSIVKAHGRDKLLYWGFSYGSVLGATYAAMFPNNVERLVVDAVLDGDDYYETAWSNKHTTTDGALFDLYEACIVAGPKMCPLYEQSSSLIHDKVQTMLEPLRNFPLSFYNADQNNYGLLDFSTVKFAIFMSLYSPYALGRFLISALAELENGNGEAMGMLAALLFESKDLLTCDCSGEHPKPSSSGEEFAMAVQCGDGSPVHDDLDDLQRYFNNSANSSWFGDLLSLTRTACSGWKIRPKERFQGVPGELTISDRYRPEPVTEKFTQMHKNTSHPLLLIGNTLDPKTPLANAHKMSKSFVNSVVLTQNSSGHRSVAAPSPCTANAIRAYFDHGILPAQGTVCQPDRTIFGDHLDVQRYASSTEDQEILGAMQEIQKQYFVPHSRSM